MLFGAPTFPVAPDDPWLKRIRDRAHTAKVDEGNGFEREAFSEEDTWGLVLGEWVRTQPLFHALL